MFTCRQDLIEYRSLMEKAFSMETRQILVCAGTGCISSGSLEIYAKLKEIMADRGINCTVKLEKDPHDESVGLKKSGCHGFCEMGPLVRVEPQGWLYTKVKVEDCEDIIDKSIVAGELVERLAYKKNGVVYPKQDEIPFYKRQTRLVLDHCGKINADSIDGYLAVGGYKALEKVIFEMTPDETIAEISTANLRGRGGAGFPTGRKWEQVKRLKAEKKFVICNGDEGDPGAFMDRSIMEGDPHRVIEGMMIARFSAGASEGYIYVRAEYPMAVERLQRAIDQAKEVGILGENILGSGFNFDMHINKGAGAFVCGEGSALIASIEGNRGFPKPKPPRTVEKGLFGMPTVLNNVETYANVPLIINNGADWYSKIGTGKSTGTKAFAITGNIENTGLIEIPMGTTLREVIYNIGGGIRDGRGFKAVQIGGPSGGCLTSEHLDLPLDYDSLSAAGAMIGSGGLVVMDDKTCIVEVARFFMNFTQHESCGKCTPCREGTKRMLEILENLVAGKGKEGDIELLLELAHTIEATAFCGLGKTAPNPVLSTIQYFRDEYEAHIKGYCPAGVCQKLKKITIDPALCKGCSLCSRQCPVGAISGKVKEPFTIDQSKCIKCGACVSTCKFKAIKEA